MPPGLGATLLLCPLKALSAGRTLEARLTGDSRDWGWPDAPNVPLPWRRSGSHGDPSQEHGR